VRRLDQVDVHAIPGTQGLLRPYWSPDGREVLFIANGQLQRVALAGGSPIVVCNTGTAADLSWGRKGKILLDGSATDSLRVVSAGGGTLEPASRVDRARGEVGSSWPSFLPDGERFLFIGTEGTGVGGGSIRLGKLGSLESKVLGHSDGRVEWAPGDWVLFLQGSVLMAQKLDLPRQADRSSDPDCRPLAHRPVAGHFSTSPDGILAFASDPGGQNRRLVTMSRAGVIDTRTLAAEPPFNPALSPDGKKILYLRLSTGVLGLGEAYVTDLERGTDTRLTFTNDRAIDPVWAPDGKRFAYGVRRPDGGLTIRIGSSDGLGAQDSIPIQGAIGEGISQWSAAGSRIVGFGNRKCWAVATEGPDRVPRFLVDSTLFAAQGRISPDGRWVTVTSGNPPNYSAYVYGIDGNTGRFQLTAERSLPPALDEGRQGDRLRNRDRSGRGRHRHEGRIPRRGSARLAGLPFSSPSPGIFTWEPDPSGDRFYVVAPNRDQAASKVEVVSDFHSLVSRR
jgi:Tol biopolymer transport system component